MDSKLQLPKKVLVVDDDVTLSNLITSYLESFGVEKIDQLHNGLEAWETLKDDGSDYDMVCLDWKLQGLSGLAILNRLRATKRYALFPVMVVSGFVSQVDFRYLSESPVCGLVEKPVASQDFQKKMHSIFQEYSWYHVNTDLISTILDSMKLETDESIDKISQVIKNAPNPVPLSLIVARSLRKRKMLDSAEKLLQELLEATDDKLLPLTELGKVYLEKRDFPRGLDILKQAQDMSPDNINRLMLMGEANMEIGGFFEAGENFEKALELDPTNNKAEAGYNISQRALRFFNENSKGLPGGLASSLNALGIGLVRSGSFKEGIKQYEQAMVFLSDPHTQARVAFNAGLGFMRSGKTDEARPWFEKSRTLSGGKFAKAQGYIDKIDSGRFAIDDRVIDDIEEEFSEEEILHLARTSVKAG